MTATEPWLHVVLYQPEIPQNTGNISRTCAAVGARLWLVKPLGFSLDAKAVRRAGLDYWPHVDYRVMEDWEHLAGELPLERAWFFTKRAARSYTEARFARGEVLVFGRETTGLPEELLAPRRERALRIPQRPVVRSLNLSNAVAVAVYEAARQLQVNLG